MKPLKEISIENLNQTIYMLGENNRLLNIANVMGDKNAKLKLEFQKKNLNKEIEYHREKISE